MAIDEPPNAYQTFNHLLLEAHDASDAVDRFDLDSLHLESVKEFERLTIVQNVAFVDLMQHVQNHYDEIIRFMVSSNQGK